MSTKARIVLIILSYLALINVTCIPIYGDEVGFLAEDFQPRFGEVMENVFQDEAYKERRGDEITVSIFFPVMVMCVASLFGKRTLFDLACGVGVAAWFLMIGRQVIYYSLYKDGFQRLFDVEQGNVAIGTWIAIALFGGSYWISNHYAKKENNVRQIRR